MPAKRLRKLQLSAAALILLLALPSARAELQQEMESILVQESLAGVTWMLLDGDAVTTGTAGYQNLPSRKPFTSDTRVHVGSVTKSVLATGVLRLATQGLINLDAPANNYLPGELRAQIPEFSDVTVRHLLDHTAGVDDARLWQMFSERASPDDSLLAAFPRPTALLQLRGVPGERFSYSNMGYTLLGLIVEQVVGERYETYLDRELLQPLGMRDSTFSFTRQDGPGADPRLAWGHVDDGSMYAAAPVFLRPAAQFTTTAADLGRFAGFLLGEGKVGDEAFIETPLMRARGVARGTAASQAGLPAGYALGLARRDRHGVVGFCHGGNILGFSAMLCVYPQEKKAFAYSVNSDREGARYSLLGAALVKALELKEAQQPPSAADDCLMCRAGFYIPAPNRFAMFRYLDRLFAALWVAPGDNQLTVLSVQGSDRTLRPLGAGLFSAHDRSTASHVFFSGPEGRQYLSTGFQSYQRVSTFSQLLRWFNLGLGLAGIIWIVIRAAVLLLRHARSLQGHPLTPTVLALLAFTLPISLFFTQSFMALGDVTAASVLLALVSGALPVAAVVGLWRGRALRRPVARIDAAALLGVLQWCLVLAWSDMLPLRLWA